MDGRWKPCATANADAEACDDSAIPQGMERCFPFFLDTSSFQAEQDNGSNFGCSPNVADLHLPALQSSAWIKAIEDTHHLISYENHNPNTELTSAETGFLDLFNVLWINHSHLFDPKLASDKQDHCSCSSSAQVFLYILNSSFNAIDI
jgi:hypothetical protein